MILKRQLNSRVGEPRRSKSRLFGSASLLSRVLQNAGSRNNDGFYINTNVAVGDVTHLLEENDPEGSVAFEYVDTSANKKPAKWRAA
jgi:hypothetical protein